MADLFQFRCKKCGGQNDLRNAQNGVIACEFCGAAWTVPKAETPPEAAKYLHDGNAALDVCKFDDAFTYFQKAAELDPEEPEAYFGMALAQFKVQYLKDEVNDCLQPVCHEISENVFTEDRNYKRALECATKEQKKVYRRKGGEIDDIRDEFFALKDSGLSYDCFLCVKVTEEDGRTHTEDYNRANDIYYHLKDKGYKPFYSEREIKERTGAAYEALILYALYTSECMLIVCSDEDYLQTKWVKNEYTRFIGLMSDGGKERDALTFVFAGKPIEKLPNGKKIQGIDLSKPDAYSHITEYVENHTPEARKRKGEAKQKKLAEEEEREKLVDDLVKNQAQLQQELKKAQVSIGNTINNKLVRGWQEIEARDFGEADRFFAEVLESDPQNGEAWYGRLLANFKCVNDVGLISGLTQDRCSEICRSKYFKNAVHYAASEEIKKKLGGITVQFGKFLEQKNSGLNRQLETKRAEAKALDNQGKQLDVRIQTLKNSTDTAEQKLNSTKKLNNAIDTVTSILGVIAFIVFLVLFFIRKWLPSWWLVFRIGAAIVGGLGVGFAMVVIGAILRPEGKIQKIQAHIEDIQKEIEPLNGQKEELKNKKASKAKEISEVNSKICTCNAEIKSLEEMAVRLKNQS